VLFFEKLAGFRLFCFDPQLTKPSFARANGRRQLPGAPSAAPLAPEDCNYRMIIDGVDDHEQ
jgi:hypothetical protein